jgi:hypothetical protein
MPNSVASDKAWLQNSTASWRSRFSKCYFILNNVSGGDLKTVLERHGICSDCGVSMVTKLLDENSPQSRLDCPW